MKINISILPEEMNGYVNICPSQGCDPFKLPYEDGQCVEIIVSLTDYIPYSKFNDIVRHYVTKLRHGGSIIFVGTDLVEVYKILLNTNDILSANKSLYGEQNHAWGFKKSCTTLRYIVDLLKSFGLHISRQRFAEAEFMVEAVRV